MNAALGRSSPELEVELPAVPNSVRAAREAAAEIAMEVGAPMHDVRLAVSEAVGNAVTHAFRGRQPGVVRLLGTVRGDRLVLSVVDNGTGMRANPDSGGLGMGIPLISKLAMDARFDSDESGTAVSMSFPAAKAGAR